MRIPSLVLETTKMKTEPNDKAFPTDGRTITYGLTKRELFAALAMQGFCANGELTSNTALALYKTGSLKACDKEFTNAPAAIAAMTVLYADALIEALNK